MEDKNPLLITKTQVEQKFQDLQNQITFDALRNIQVDEQGKEEIDAYIKRCKNGIAYSIDRYLNHKGSCFYHVDLSELEKILIDDEIDFDDLVDEISQYYTAIIIYSLVQYYLGKLKSSDRNDHHSSMYINISQFALKYYHTSIAYLGFDSYFIKDIIGWDDLDGLLYWFEFATKTHKDWTV